MPSRASVTPPPCPTQNTPPERRARAMLIEFHRTILADRLRNEAFHEALRRVIVPGQTTVADVGSGTGLLGFMAARLGAKRVYLYEHGDVLALSKTLARRNHIRRCV